MKNLKNHYNDEQYNINCEEIKIAVGKKPRGAANTMQRSSVDEKVLKEIKNEETIKTSVIINRGVRV